MTKITQLPVVSTMADQSVFVVVDNGVTKKLTYSTLKATLKGDKGETGLKGDKGDTGVTGAQGPKGDTGAQGPVGPLAPFSTATDVRLGGIKIGSGITIDGQGVLSVPIVTITTATSSVPGTVKPGDTLSLLDSDATLSVIPRLYHSSFKEFFVLSQGSIAYTFSGVSGSNPALNNILPGSTVAFVLEETAHQHPFQIRTSNGGAAATDGQFLFVGNDGTVLTGALANSGQVSGTLFWTIPDVPTQSVFYYQCTRHPGMVGQINIKNDAVIIDARIAAELATVSQDIIPDGNLTRYLGSQSNRWHSLFVGPGSVDVNGAKLSESNGKLLASGGFFTGKSITKLNVTTPGLYRERPDVRVYDSQGQDFTAVTFLNTTTVAALIYDINDTLSKVQPTDTVTIEFLDSVQGIEGGGAQATPVVDFFVKDLILGYKNPPTSSIVFSVQTTLNGQAQTVISDNAILTSLSNFLPYVQMTEDRDGLPTFLDPVANRTKALKIVDVDIPSGVVTFEIGLAFATIPAGTYVYQVPVLEIADNSFPIICQGNTIARLDIFNNNKTIVMVDKLDSARLPSGVASGDFQTVTCTGLVNSGQIGYYFLASDNTNNNINKTETEYGVVGVTLTNGGIYRNKAPEFRIYKNGQDTGYGGTSVLTPAPVSRIDITNYGSGFTDNARIEVGIPDNTNHAVSDSNVWTVIYDNQSKTTGSVSGVSFFVSTNDPSRTISQGMVVRPLNVGNLTPGTVASVTPIFNTRDYRLYRVNMSQAATFGSITANTKVSFGTNEAVVGFTAQASGPIVPATTSSIGSVIVGDGLTVNQNGVVSATISLSLLKSVVASSTSWADFQSRVAGL